MTTKKQIYFNNVWNTTDFSIAAYVLMREISKQYEIKLLSINKNKKQAGNIFNILDPNNKCNSLAIDFYNSKLCIFDQLTRMIKKVCFSSDIKEYGILNGYKTNSFPFAAFLRMNNFELVGFRKIYNDRKMYELFFDDKEKQCKKLLIDFNNSNELNYDNSRRSLRQICS